MALMWDELERIFNRSFQYCFSWKKWLFVFPVLTSCGIFAVLCHTLSLGAGKWVGVTLAFLPTFACSGILLAAAVPMIRLYHDEVKGKPLHHRQTIRQSWPLMRGLAALSLPLLLAYLVLWSVFGIFHLLKAIPTIGAVLGGILSFGPFLLIAGSLCLSLIALLFLFFLTPYVALKSKVYPKLVEEFFVRLRSEPFSHLSLCRDHSASHRLDVSHRGRGAHRSDLFCPRKDLDGGFAVVLYHDSLRRHSFSGCGFFL